MPERGGSGSERRAVGCVGWPAGIASDERISKGIATAETNAAAAARRGRVARYGDAVVRIAIGRIDCTACADGAVAGERIVDKGVSSAADGAALAPGAVVVERAAADRQIAAANGAAIGRTAGRRVAVEQAVRYRTASRADGPAASTGGHVSRKDAAG